MGHAKSTQPPEQIRLNTGVKAAHRNHDYIGLFGDHIFPTGDIDILERSNHLLIIKSVEHGRPIRPAQKKLFKVITRFDTVNAPGSVTVVCVWGLGVLSTRTWIEFTNGREAEFKDRSVDEWRSYLQTWWRQAGMYR